MHENVIVRPPELARGPAGLIEWLQSRGPTLQSVQARFCATVFRDFAIETARDFEALLDALEVPRAAYAGGNTPRSERAPRIYTATDYTASQPISLHNELSYSYPWPSSLYFCCVRPADRGGATLLADGRRVLAGLDPSIVDAFRRRGVRYVRNLHGGRGLGRSWQATFETDDRKQVERACAAAGSEWTWLEGGGLRVVHHGPGVLDHPSTGEAVWFNQAEQFHVTSLPREVARLLLDDYRGREQQLPHWASFADGDAIPLEMLDAIRDQLQRETVRVDWERGDFMIVDNILALHGRSPYAGPRELLVAMAHGWRRPAEGQP